jgi:hypothetical protein
MKKYGLLMIVALLSALFSCSKEKLYDPLEISYQAKMNMDNVIYDKILYSEIIGYKHLYLLDR